MDVADRSYSDNGAGMNVPVTTIVSFRGGIFDGEAGGVDSIEGSD